MTTVVAPGDAATFTVDLGGTSWLDDGPVSTASLRPLTGRDEEALAQRRGTAAGTVSWLLGRCITRLDDGDVYPGGVGPDVADRFTVGDRETFLWHLRREAAGDAIDVVVDCSACGEALDLHLSTEAIIPLPAPSPSPDHSLTLSDGTRLAFRLPTGATQHAGAQLVDADPAAAEEVMLEHCLLGPPPDDHVHPAWRTQLAAAMAELDPGAQTNLDTTCAACRSPQIVALDAWSLLSQELELRRAELELAIHLFALHYHWRDTDTTTLSLLRRRRLLELLVNGGGQ